MRFLFACVGRVHVLRQENTNQAGGFLLASNHISHFDPFIISGFLQRKIDWMAMAEFFPVPVVGFFLRAIDAFPADRHRADRSTIRTAIERLKAGRSVGIFPEGGIRDGARSLLEGAPLRPGAATLAHMAGVSILPCVIVGSDRFYGKRSWLPFRRTPVWIAFGNPIPNFSELEKSTARERIESELASAFKSLYAELREKFSLTADDLPRPPRERMAAGSISIFSRASATTVDSLMCLSMNLVQSRHRLNSRSREEMERYVIACETQTIHDFYAVPHDAVPAIGNGELDKSQITSATWASPVASGFAKNDVVRVDLYPCTRGWTAPTVLMLHALMSANDIGYRRWAARFNELGWNACFVHLPYHYSRTPRGHWNGELAITANLVRNAEGLRQGVIEVRQLLAALRERGGTEFGILGTSYGAWIGALVAAVERDFRFLALMAPIVNVEHAIWQCPATIFMRHELRRARIEPALVARHHHLSSPSHIEPLCNPDRVLFASGEFDLIARPEDIAAVHEKWHGSELLQVRQGHFGYRMMRETFARLKERGL